MCPILGKDFNSTKVLKISSKKQIKKNKHACRCCHKDNRKYISTHNVIKDADALANQRFKRIYLKLAYWPTD